MVSTNRERQNRCTSTQVFLGNLLELAAFVPLGRTTAVRISIIFLNHQSVRMDISLARIYPRAARGSRNGAHRPSCFGDIAYRPRVRTSCQRVLDWSKYQQMASTLDLFSNQQHPTESNLLTYFYRFEFQSRGTLHLHMLVWVKDLSLIRANLLHASISWNNANDAFLVADTQQPSSSSSSCLPLCDTPDFFIQRADGSMHLQFHFTEQDLSRNLRMHHNASWCTTMQNRRPASRWQGHVVEVRVVLCHENTRGGYSGRIVWQ